MVSTNASAAPRPSETLDAGALLRRQARDIPDTIFAVFPDGDAWTFADALRQAEGVKAGLRRIGVSPGDTVLTMLPNGRDGLRALLGVWLAGAVYAPLNTAYRGDLLQHVVNLSQARVMLAHDQVVERLRGLALPELSCVIAMGGDGEIDLGPDITLAGPDTIAPEQAHSGEDHDEPRETWRTCALIYTSGTTGPSKAVEQSWAFYDAFCNTMYGELSADDRYYGYLPLFHTGGVSMAYAILRLGASMVMTQAFSTSTYWDDVRRYGVTSACIMGSMGAAMEREEPRDDDADNPMRFVMMGPMVENIEAFRRRFGVELFTEYGTTEVGIPFRSGFDVADHTTCGRLVEGYQVRLVDAYDRDVPDGEAGELVVRHDRPWVLNSGYRGMPDKTAEAWRNGWFHTGDLFRRAPSGDYFFVDRAKDALRRRGENVSSLEVETELLKHPDIMAAAVVGVASGDGVGEEEIKACLVLRPDSDIDFHTYIPELAERMPHFMVPRFFELLPELPMTSTSKIRKVELRARGVTPETFDREAAGIKIRREKLRA